MRRRWVGVGGSRQDIYLKRISAHHLSLLAVNKNYTITAIWWMIELSRCRSAFIYRIRRPYYFSDSAFMRLMSTCKFYPPIIELMMTFAVLKIILDEFLQAIFASREMRYGHRRLPDMMMRAVAMERHRDAARQGFSILCLTGKGTTIPGECNDQGRPSRPLLIILGALSAEHSHWVYIRVAFAKEFECRIYQRRQERAWWYWILIRAVLAQHFYKEYHLKSFGYRRQFIDANAYERYFSFYYTITGSISRQLFSIVESRDDWYSEHLSYVSIWRNSTVILPL